MPFSPLYCDSQSLRRRSLCICCLLKTLKVRLRVQGQEVHLILDTLNELRYTLQHRTRQSQSVMNKAIYTILILQNIAFYTLFYLACAVIQIYYSVMYLLLNSLTSQHFYQHLKCFFCTKHLRQWCYRKNNHCYHPKCNYFPINSTCHGVLFLLCHNLHLFIKE